jgi:hypothetical protein
MNKLKRCLSKLAPTASVDKMLPELSQAALHLVSCLILFSWCISQQKDLICAVRSQCVHRVVGPKTTTDGFQFAHAMPRLFICRIY